ncbi:HDIG domain-containing metalloprotein [Desulfonatronovibrio hydrogenovorans]|uniref:HDIG domain-containing metalloprotein n=1 Tax=Desulfonatronovibrio hydrogenovorans TaxID=53245 RepID=UPI000491EAE1|nr:HDIG domain-containing metalloprotein [Desulfonatronovibrio hydrogenovorans]
MISRDQALEMLKQNLKEENLVRHSLSTEAVLKNLARELGRDEEVWGLTGLLHDLDYSLTADNPSQHGIESSAMLTGQLPEEALQAIKVHAAEMNRSGHPESELDFGLRCGETVTGLIMAAGLVRPNGLDGMKPKSLKKKIKDKAFAASVNREIIQEHEKLGLDLTSFLALSIAAMQSISREIGFAQSP